MSVSGGAARDTRPCVPIRTESRRSGREKLVGRLGADGRLIAIRLVRVLIDLGFANPGGRRGTKASGDDAHETWVQFALIVEDRLADLIDRPYALRVIGVISSSGVQCTPGRCSMTAYSVAMSCQNRCLFDFDSAEPRKRRMEIRSAWGTNS